MQILDYCAGLCRLSSSFPRLSWRRSLKDYFSINTRGCCCWGRSRLRVVRWCGGDGGSGPSGATGCPKRIFFFPIWWHSRRPDVKRFWLSLNSLNFASPWGRLSERKCPLKRAMKGICCRGWEIIIAASSAAENVFNKYSVIITYT